MWARLSISPPHLLQRHRPNSFEAPSTLSNSCGPSQPSCNARLALPRQGYPHPFQACSIDLRQAYPARLCAAQPTIARRGASGSPAKVRVQICRSRWPGSLSSGQKPPDDLHNSRRGVRLRHQGFFRSQRTNRGERVRARAAARVDDRERWMPPAPIGRSLNRTFNAVWRRLLRAHSRHTSSVGHLSKADGPVTPLKSNLWGNPPVC
jgi:hypothetical protein